MNNVFRVVVVYIFANIIAGCAGPDRVTTISSPTQGLFFTVETFNGHGAVDSDFTRVYAHFEHNGKAQRILVLDGENLTVAKIVWVGPREGTFCLEGGITDTFRNEVTLTADDVSETIRNHLQEDCSKDSSASATAVGRN